MVQLGCTFFGLLCDTKDTLYSPGSILEISVDREIIVPVLSAGSLSSLGTELQGVTRQDQCLLETFSLIPWEVRPWRNERTIVCKAKGRLQRERCGLCLWALAGWVSTGLVNIPKLSDPPVSPKDFIWYAWVLFITWRLGVQKFQRVGTEFLPNSFGAGQVGRS